MVSHLSLVLAMIIVGSTVTVSKVVTTEFPVYLALVMRFLIGTLFLYFVLRAKGVRLSGLGLRVHMVTVAQSLLGSVLFNYFLLTGLKTASAVSAGILTGTLPAVVMLLSVILLRERAGANQYAGVLLATSGVILVNLAGGDAGGAGSLYGGLLILAAVVCEALFLLLRKVIPLNISSLVLSFYVSLYGLIIFLPFGFSEAVHGGFGMIDLHGCMLIAYYGLFITAIAYILWFKGINRVESSIASVYTAVMPLSAVVLSSVFLKEKVTAMHMGGFVLVVSAMLLINLERLRRL